MSRPIKEHTQQRDIQGTRFQLHQEVRKSGGDWIYVIDSPTDPNASPESPFFQNNWENVGGDDTPLRFRWLLDGEVEIEGHITGGADNTVVFTLPPPLYLRDKNLRVAGVTDDTDVVVFEIQLDGDVVYIGQATGPPPSGPAGGDLTGTYPNPDIAPLSVEEGMIDSDGALAGDVLTADGLGGASFTTGGAGPTGVTGVTGATGPAGVDGLDGPIGPTGPAGVTGATGPAGSGGGSSVDSIDWPGPIGIQVDNSTVEIPGGVLRVKDLGITAGKLGSGAATVGQIATADGSGGVSYEDAGTVSGGLSALFGNGDDGALSLTQSSAAPAWATKSGAGATTTFTLSRDIFATSIDFDDSAGNFLVRTNGFRIFCTGTMTIDAGVTVHNNGNTGTSGGAGLSRGTMGASGAGGAGGAGGSGSNPTAITGSIATDQTTATTIGGAGGNEVGSGGTGGGAATGGQASNAANNGNPRNIAQALDPRLAGSATLFIGGAGGGGGDATAGGIGGRGGGGGGIVGIYTRTLINNGSITATGGVAENGLGGGTGTGGGGGGSGGAIILVYVASGSTVGTVTAGGGGGGTPTGTGNNGGSGSSGIVFDFGLA